MLLSLGAPGKHSVCERDLIRASVTWQLMWLVILSNLGTVIGTST